MNDEHMSVIKSTDRQAKLGAVAAVVGILLIAAVVLSNDSGKGLDQLSQCEKLVEQFSVCVEYTGDTDNCAGILLDAIGETK